MWKTFQEVARVPLIVKKPGSEGPVNLESVVSLLDIPTTILRNEAIPIPGEYEGDSIFENRRGYAISETNFPAVRRLAKDWGNLHKVHFTDYIYSIRDKEYTIVYDRNCKYTFFDRKDDVMEKKQIAVTNSRLNYLLNSLKEHQLNSPKQHC